LNRVRVDLKHRGIMPAQVEIEAARVHVRDFFVENIPIMFSLNLEDASLVPMVSYDEARRHLERAEAAIRRESYNEAMAEIAFAFHALIEEFETRISSVRGHSPYVFSEVSDYRPLHWVGNLGTLGGGSGPTILGGTRNLGDEWRQRELERFADEVSQALSL